MNRGSLIKNLRYLWTGQHNKINDRFVRKNNPVIEHFEIKSSTISSDKPFHFHLDGDLKKIENGENGKYTVKFTILPESITFLVPEVFYNKFHPPGLR